MNEPHHGHSVRPTIVAVKRSLIREVRTLDLVVKVRVKGETVQSYNDGWNNDQVSEYTKVMNVCILFTKHPGVTD